MDEPQATTTPVCYRHPDRATRLACSECERPICVDCSRDAAVGQKCPECAEPVGRNRVVQVGRQVRSGPSFQTNPVTMTLIWVNVAIFALGFLWSDVVQYVITLGDQQFTIRTTQVIADFGQINLLVENGEWWRAITATFLHGGLMHIFFNMYALYLLGASMERGVGSLPFATLYAASGLAGSVAWLLLGETASPAVGASGAIFGLFGAWIVNAYSQRHTPAGRAQLRQFGFLILINLALPLFIPNIAWQAHVGGLVAGALIAGAWMLIRTPGRAGLMARTIPGVVTSVALLAVLLGASL